VGGIGGLALAINDQAGILDASAVETNRLVNILSKPTLLVRDGATATISVGSDISIVGNTTIDPILGQRQTVASEYRKTGLDISILPTVNASDIVIMEIDQKISNSVPGSAGAGGNPDIFERSISTQVLSASGQTILLGGLISQDSNGSERGIPIAKNIPGLGRLFRGNSESRQKTELIIMITPRVLETVSSWRDVTEAFKSGLNELEFRLEKQP
jgi:general secretion pathway protein D